MDVRVVGGHRWVVVQVVEAIEERLVHCRVVLAFTLWLDAISRSAVISHGRVLAGVIPSLQAVIQQRVAWCVTPSVPHLHQVEVRLVLGLRLHQVEVRLVLCASRGEICVMCK